MTPQKAASKTPACQATKAALKDVGARGESSNG